MSQATESPPARPGRPAAQYLSAEHVVAEMADHGTRRLRTLSVLQILVLAMLAGGFVTVGALFSVLLAVGIASPGVQRLVEGFAFSAGFFFVILADAVLFTEANAVLPATILRCPRKSRLPTIARFWALAWIGNLAGAVLVGYAIHLALRYRWSQPSSSSCHLADTAKPPDGAGIHYVISGVQTLLTGSCGWPAPDVSTAFRHPAGGWRPGSRSWRRGTARGR